jgi:hypothetical protein
MRHLKNFSSEALMEIRRVEKNVFDVFQGSGWHNWTRIKNTRGNTFVLAGSRLPRPMLRELHEILFPYFPINYGQSVEETVRNLGIIFNGKA